MNHNRPEKLLIKALTRVRSATVALRKHGILGKRRILRPSIVKCRPLADYFTVTARLGSFVARSWRYITI